MSSLTVFVEKVNELKALMKSEGKNALTTTFKEFFEAHPMAAKVVWTQYAPYFNDGDACVFSVHEPVLKLNSSKVAPDVLQLMGLTPVDHLDEDEDDTDDDCYDDETQLLESLEDDEPPSWNDPCKKYGVAHRKLTDAERSLVDDFAKLASDIQELPDLMEEVFGSDCKVIATAKGIETEEYSHD